MNGTLDARVYVAHAGTMAGGRTFNAGTGTVVLDNTQTIRTANTQTIGTAAVASFYTLRLEDPIETRAGSAAQRPGT